MKGPHFLHKNQAVSFAIHLLIVTALCVQWAHAISDFSPQYVQQHWGEDQGAPVGDINGIVQDDVGYIWLASFDGLIRFDGVDFVQFNTTNTDFPSNRFTTIRKTAGRVLWLSSDEGHLVRVIDGVATTMTVADGMPNARVVRVTPKGDDGLAYGTLDGVALVDGREITSISGQQIEGEVTAIHWPNEQHLWVATQSGLYQVTNPLGEATINIWSLDQEILSLMTHDNRLWLGTSDGVHVLVGDGFERQFEYPTDHLFWGFSDWIKGYLACFQGPHSFGLGFVKRDVT